MQAELDEYQQVEAAVVGVTQRSENMRDTSAIQAVFDNAMSQRDTGEDAEAIQFLEAALRKLGHVSVFAFATGDFMLVGPGGDRVRGHSLGAALREMLRSEGFGAGGQEDD